MDYLRWLDMNAGPEYYFYWRCAITHITIIICVVFGYCMPVLYLVGFVSIYIQYIFDRYRIAYFYRLPPMFNTELTLNLCSYMNIASIVGLCMLFWQYTNKQMFDNKIDPIIYPD